MTLQEIPLFSMLRGKLGFLNERQRVISQNVANANTPGYAPSDLKPFTIAQAMAAPQGGATSVSTVRTNVAHLPGKTVTKSNWRQVTAGDSETTLDGNQVVLEDQMVKMTEARLDYDAAISFYQKSMGLIRLAAKRPGS
jgi:flagellar basal-body rod protein FlgB